MVLGLLLVLPPAAVAAPAVEVTMKNVDLQTLIKQVGTLTGTTVISVAEAGSITVQWVGDVS